MEKGYNPIDRYRVIVDGASFQKFCNCKSTLFILIKDIDTHQTFKNLIKNINVYI